MADLIDNPVINSPFAEPQRHFRFAENGITDEIVPGRWRSTYFVSIAKPKFKGDIKALYYRKICIETYRSDSLVPWRATPSAREKHTDTAGG